MGESVSSLPAMGFTASTTLNRLSANWNELRNAALGRGTRPGGCGPRGCTNPELVEQVAVAYERFRAWADTRSAGLLTTFTNQYWYTEEAAAWEATRRNLATQVTAETGIPLADTILPPIQEFVGEAAKAAAAAAKAALPVGRMLTGLLLAGAIFIAVKRLTPNRARRAA